MVSLQIDNYFHDFDILIQKDQHDCYVLQSGCIKSKDSKQLIIALEPEAASFHCRQLDLSPFQDSELCFPSGLRYLVLDCGGKHHSKIKLIII